MQFLWPFSAFAVCTQSICIRTPYESWNQIGKCAPDVPTLCVGTCSTDSQKKYTKPLTFWLHGRSCLRSKRCLVKYLLKHFILAVQHKFHRVCISATPSTMWSKVLAFSAHTAVPVAKDSLRLGVVGSEAPTHLLRPTGRRSFTTFQRRHRKFPRCAQLEPSCRHGWVDVGPCYTLCLRGPNPQPPVQRTTLRPPSGGTASPSPVGSRTGFLLACLPNRLHRRLPNPPHPDRPRYCCRRHCRWRCCSWGLARGPNWHRRPLVSLSVMAATGLCRPAVPSAWGCATGVHWLGR